MSDNRESKKISVQTWKIQGWTRMQEMRMKKKGKGMEDICKKKEKKRYDKNIIKLITTL